MLAVLERMGMPAGRAAGRKDSDEVRMGGAVGLLSSGIGEKGIGIYVEAGM